MQVTYMVDGEIESEAEMDAVPRTGEKVWLTLTRNGRQQYQPAFVTAVDWHGHTRAEIRLSTSR